MRMRRRSLNGEEGVSAVLIVLALTVLLGMVSLSIDGGLLFLKRRALVNANDAASLAAALSCAKSEGQGAADSQADLLAVDNVADATRFAAPAYDPGCDAPSGKVTVNYQADQALFFSQVVGVSSPKVVRSAATATWGGAGGAQQVVPLMLSMNRLSSCGIPLTVNVGDHCFFWWDNGNQNDQTALTNAEWGLMDLRAWDVAADASCPGNVNQNEVGEWISTGFNGPLLLHDPAPTFVCRGSGFQGNALNNDINAIAGQIVPMPVNDPDQQVQSNGTLCRPNGVDGACTVHKYAIVGFGILEIVQVWTGNEAQVKCDHPAQNNGSLRCLEAIWRGYRTTGLSPGGGGNFGLVGVSLSG